MYNRAIFKKPKSKNCLLILKLIGAVFTQKSKCFAEKNVELFVKSHSQLSLSNGSSGIAVLATNRP